MPPVYRELETTYQALERHYRDMLDIEFTVQDGTLYILQVRAGKRTATAALRIALDMVSEGLIERDRALLRVDPGQLDRLLHPIFDPQAKARAIAERRLIAKGLPAAPGAAVGRAVFSADDAEEWAQRGERVILVRAETSPEDVAGMHAADGILTSRGGLTSHAAVVGRGMGKCCVVGCGDITVDEDALEFRRDDLRVRQGEVISLDGETGEVILGEVSTKPSEVLQVLRDKSLTAEASPLFQSFRTIMEWADEVRTLGVRANADTPSDAATALAFGAQGIGLCRTEHMFFKPEARIPLVREMILAQDRPARLSALEKLLPLQREDFVEILRTMAARPVTIRLLDPPLHEFLPKEREIGKELAALRAKTRKDRRRIAELETMLDTVRGLQEANPMLGHRGCRLGITYPEIYEMQVRAIFEAVVVLVKEGVAVEPEAPLFDQLEHGHRGDRLRQAAESEPGRGVHGLAGGAVDDPVAAGQHEPSVVLTARPAPGMSHVVTSRVISTSKGSRPRARQPRGSPTRAATVGERQPPPRIKHASPTPASLNGSERAGPSRSSCARRRR